MSLRTFNWPINPTTVNSRPIQIEVNGIAQTIDPVVGIFMPSQIYNVANNKINPSTEETSQAINTSVQAVDATIQGIDFATETTLSALKAKDFATETTLAALSAKLPASLGAKTTANSLAVALPTDQGAIPVSQVAATGSFAQITNLVATAQTFTAPANAMGFKIQAPSTNTENIAFSIGAVATITAGILMEPGRSEDFECGSDISVIATSSTAQRVSVLWRIKP